MKIEQLDEIYRDFKQWKLNLFREQVYTLFFLETRMIFWKKKKSWGDGSHRPPPLNLNLQESSHSGKWSQLTHGVGILCSNVCGVLTGFPCYPLRNPMRRGFDFMSQTHFHFHFRAIVVRGLRPNPHWTRERNFRAQFPWCCSRRVWTQPFITGGSVCVCALLLASTVDWTQPPAAPSHVPVAGPSACLGFDAAKRPCLSLCSFPKSLW